MQTRISNSRLAHLVTGTLVALIPLYLLVPFPVL